MKAQTTKAAMAWLDDITSYAPAPEEAGGVEYMGQDNPALLMLLRTPPESRADNPAFRITDIKPQSELAEPNRFGVRVIQTEQRRKYDAINHELRTTWCHTGWNIVQCPCGKTWPYRGDIERLRKCGCKTAQLQKYDLAGERFTRLKVDSYDARTGLWNCACDCGRSVKAATQRLRNGTARNCGACRGGLIAGVKATTAERDVAATPDVGGYKMLNVAAKHHAFLGWMKQETGMSMGELLGVALEQYYADEWAARA